MAQHFSEPTASLPRGPRAPASESVCPLISYRFCHFGMVISVPRQPKPIKFVFRLANRGRALWTRTRVIVGDLPSGSDRRKYPVGGVFLSDWGEEEEI
jgi:hypothetical protein